LQRKPLNRLGAHGPAEVKNHIWLKDFNWAQLHAKSVKSPLDISKSEENFDVRMTMEIDNMNTEEKRQNDILIRRDSVQREFLGYHYDENKSVISGNNKKMIENPPIALHKA